MYVRVHLVAFLFVTDFFTLSPDIEGLQAHVPQ